MIYSTNLTEIQVVLDLLTDNQLINLENKVYCKITENMGYQPFGIDRNTVNLTHPNELKALDAIRRERKERNI